MGSGAWVVPSGNSFGFKRNARRRSLLGTTAFAVLCGIAMAAAPVAPQARAQEQGSTRAFNIPAQPLASAINAFGRQSGLQVSVAAGAASGVRANAVNGSLSPSQALSRMLAGTGLPYRINGDGTAVIGRAEAASPGVAADGSIMLDPITVVSGPVRNTNIGSGYQGTPDWVYEQPSSVSVVSREAIESNPATRSAADTLDTVAGVITNRSEAQKPGIAVNVRGLQDMNRVTTSIDGARQNFQRAGHGSYQQVFVDTSFIRAVEIEKGAVPGVGGAGSLGGMVNFRTVEADDIIEAGKQWGAELKSGTGSNAFDFDGSAIGGVRLSEDFTIIGGISHKKIGDYKIGTHGEIPDSGEDFTVIDDKTLFSRNEVLNTLLKAEWQITDDLKLDASWLRYEADGAQGGGDGTEGAKIRRDDEHYVNNTFTTSLTYDPASELIDAKARFWYNDTSNDEQRGYDVTLPVSYGMESFGGSLENTSRFALGMGDLALHYGAEAFHDDGETKTTGLDDPNGPDGHYGFGGANPSGKRTMASGFFNATLQHEDWLTITGGLRYDYYHLYGSTVVQQRRVVVTPPQGCLVWQDIDSDGTPDPNGLWLGNDGNIYHEPGPDREFATPTCEQWGAPGSSETVYDRFPVDVDQSGGAWLPSATIAVKPFDWLQPFVSYSRSYRPPAITESLISGGHPGVPFENMPNPDLRPEKGETWELGVNISQNAVFTSDDAFRLKAVYFRRDIEDYISMGSMWYEPASTPLDTYLNLDGTTRMRGVEIEANYDLGYAYLGASYTHIDTDWADSYNLVLPPDWEGGGAQPPSPAVLFVPPKQKFTLDLGVRLFERKLVVGTRATHVSATTPEFGELVGLYVNDGYTVYDLYGSYAFTDKAKLRFGVSNLTDEKYVPALGTYSYPAPGRTYTASLALKF
jgi:hemoglobin/transferrin/lactoferrin receptor protein